jgi:hypothetical protein
MLQKTITWDDFDGKTRTEDFFFHLTKAELVELEVSEKVGFAESLQAIVEAKDGALIIEQFKRIILLAYGRKSEDGRRFIKSQELRDDFAQTEAYSQLFIELATDANAAAAFINGIVPASLAAEVEKASKNEVSPEVDPEVRRPKHVKDMTREELIAAFGDQAKK